MRDCVVHDARAGEFESPNSCNVNAALRGTSPRSTYPHPEGLRKGKRAGAVKNSLPDAFEYLAAVETEVTDIQVDDLFQYRVFFFKAEKPVQHGKIRKVQPAHNFVGGSPQVDVRVCIAADIQNILPRILLERNDL